MHPEGMDPSGHIIPKNEVLRVQGHRHLWKRLLAAEIVENSGIRSQLFLDWDMVVNVYADRQLSVPSDKLVALSGLANDMKKRLEELQPGPHRYLAGLWEDELMCQLSWCVIGSAKRVRLYRAPSWSWACLDGRVVPGLRSTELNEPVDLASLISADMVYVGKEETGEVKSGTLTLEGPYMWAKLGPPGPGIFASATSGVTSYEPMSKSVDADVWFDSLDDTAEEALLFWTWHSKHGIKGVALAMVENGFYRRLGVAGCHMWPRENMKAFLETLPRTEIRII
ncbi:hypothetical protein GQ607_008209 [Colletotrichum asianum]|uniref:Tol protein n=1 Tax=Colletotrichum asianum TaxID=702518 RepID=A0A8H3ZUX4_9PEZI|nr:hypothetical protein GQ607_008209 [Colletotrichum asianum]